MNKHCEQFDLGSVVYRLSHRIARLLLDLIIDSYDRIKFYASIKNSQSGDSQAMVSIDSPCVTGPHPSERVASHAGVRF